VVGGGSRYPGYTPQEFGVPEANTYGHGGTAVRVRMAAVRPGGVLSRKRGGAIARPDARRYSDRLHTIMFNVMALMHEQEMDKLKGNYEDDED